MWMNVWENSFFAISALSTLLGVEHFNVESRKISFLKFLAPENF